MHAPPDHKGNGRGHFISKTAFDLGGIVSGLAVADFNGDGMLDIAANRNVIDRPLYMLFGDQEGRMPRGVNDIHQPIQECGILGWRRVQFLRLI